jgi:hydroxypyruvate isomerase
VVSSPAPLLAEAARIGYEGVDLADEEFWPLIIKHGLQISAVVGHASLVDGLNRRENGHRIEEELKARIALAAKWKIPSLICFSGNRGDRDDKEGLDQSAEILARVAGMAANAGVILVMELLNSKIDHPGYQCDHTSWGVQLVKQVNSPAVRLLYDVYHMQIMEGDIIRTIQENHSYFSHYHTAGNPGRGQPDEHQEIYYPAIYSAIQATGYKGFIGHEFVPEGNPVDAMARAFTACAAVGSGKC